MRAIILAAGMGRRLGIHAEGLPKCLVEVGGQSILEHQLSALEKAGIDKFTIVVGYQAEMVKSEARRLVGNRVDFVVNPIFDRSNTSYSLWLATQDIAESFYYLNGDVLFSSEIINRLETGETDSNLALEVKICGAEEVKVLTSESRAISISKEVPPDEASGEFIGVARFSRETGQALHRALETVVLEEADLMAYFEKGLDKILSDYPVNVVNVSDLPSVEIDFPEDLEYARDQVLPEILQQEMVAC